MMMSKKCIKHVNVAHKIIMLDVIVTSINGNLEFMY